MTASAPTPLKHLDKALGVLRNLGLVKQEPAPAHVSIRAAWLRGSLGRGR